MSDQDETPKQTNPNLRPPWPKGYCPNPGGRPKRQLTADKLADIIDRFSFMLPAELEAIIEAKTAPLIEIQIASIIVAGIKQGDPARLNFILERIIGKVPDLSINANINRDEQLDQVPKMTLEKFLKSVG